MIENGQEIGDVIADLDLAQEELMELIGIALRDLREAPARTVTAPHGKATGLDVRTGQGIPVASISSLAEEPSNDDVASAGEHQSRTAAADGAAIPAAVDEDLEMSVRRDYALWDTVDHEVEVRERVPRRDYQGF